MIAMATFAAGCIGPQAEPASDVPVESASLPMHGGMQEGMQGHTVQMRQDVFHPMHLEVRAGDTITWINEDAYMHTVTSDDVAGPLDSGVIEGGESWSFTFDEPGTYEYHCEPHAWRGASGAYEGMVATIVAAR